MRSTRWTKAAAIVATGLTVAACTSGRADDTASSDGLPMVPAEAGHLHGMGVNPADDKLYLGTHAGLMVVEDDGVERVGEATIDLMGFAIAGPDHFYASGHPGLRDDLPNPVGLIETTDGGQSWRVLSLSGESDFHTLAASPDAAYGFDGALRATVDGRTWTAGAPDVETWSIAIDPEEATTLVATTDRGPVISTDGGKTFAGLADAPPVALLAWPESDALWGITADGDLFLSTDGGASWTAQGNTGGAPEAFTASDADSVFVALEDGIQRSDDSGKTFEPIAGRA